MTFEELELEESLLRAVKEEGYVEPSPIQAQAIPPALEGRDVLGCAQTGTGKTAAFALPILQRLGAVIYNAKVRRPIRALILTPTRELALQIMESFQAYGKYTRLKSAVVFGGVSQNAQTEELARGVDILVATPGRLWDLMNQGYISLRDVQILVLDEADRMLDMGFIHDVKRILTKVPEDRQTLFFSATMPPDIINLVSSILKDYVRVAVTPVSSTVETIRQSIYFVDKPNKRKLLAHLLENEEITSALVFTRTKHGADRVVRELKKSQIDAMAIHGDKSQGARQSALNRFKSGGVRVLVATDIAARGIDVEDISHVINYDLPNIPETYVHRIGRTGRAGASGSAISFCDFDEKAYLKDIQKLIGQEIPVVEDNLYPMQIFEASPKPQQQARPPRKPQVQKAPESKGPQQSAAHRRRRPRRQSPASQNQQ